MDRVRDKGLWGLVGLLILGLLSVVLSIAAVSSVESDSDSIAPARTSFDFGTPVGAEGSSNGQSAEDESSGGSDEESDETVDRSDGQSEEEATDEISGDAMDSGPSAAVVGDSNSIDESTNTWAALVGDELAWENVTNLSAPGRGYITTPFSCDESPCAPFDGTVEVLAEIDPDIVIVFGGAADGDVPITETAAETFADMRSALPEAEIIAISPVYSEETVPAWAPLHAASIQAGVEAAGGTYIDVGQPSLGDSGTMSAGAHAEIARIVIEALQ